MAASRDLLSLLSDSRTIALMDATIQKVMGRIIRELAAGVSRTGAQRAKDLLAKLSYILYDLDPAKQSFIRRWIEDAASKAYVLGDKGATAALRAELAGVATAVGTAFGPINTSWTAVNQNAMRGMVAAMNARFTGMAKDMAVAIGTLVRKTQVTLLQSKAIVEATSGGITRGATGRQVADDIAAILLKGKIDPAVEARLQEHGFTAELFKDFERVAREQLVTVGGRRMSVRAYADLVARTQMREAHKVATIIRLQQNGVDHVKVSKHPMKEPDPCTPWAGRVFYIGQGKDPAGFPPLREALNGGPPFHPNCKHVLQPWVIGFMSKKRVDSAKAEADAIPDKFFGKDYAGVQKALDGMDEKALGELALSHDRLFEEAVS